MPLYASRRALAHPVRCQQQKMAQIHPVAPLLPLPPYCTLTRLQCQAKPSLLPMALRQLRCRRKRGATRRSRSRSLRPCHDYGQQKGKVVAQCVRYKMDRLGLEWPDLSRGRPSIAIASVLHFRIRILRTNFMRCRRHRLGS